MRKTVRSILPNRAVYHVERLSDTLSESLAERRFQILLLSSFAVTALLLAAIGLYGVTSFLVMQRTREIGLRVALGGKPRADSVADLRQGAIMTAGDRGRTSGGSAVDGSMASLLFGIAPGDPVTSPPFRVCWLAWHLRRYGPPRAAPRASIRWRRCVKNNLFDAQ